MILPSGYSPPPAARPRRTPHRVRCWRRCVAAGAAVLATAAFAARATALPAAPAPAVRPAGTVFGDDELMVRDVFQSHLPRTLAASALRLWLHPRLGDLARHDDLRFSAGLRYGLTHRIEVGAGSDVYLSHGFGRARLLARGGAASVECGAKINLGPVLFRGWNTAAGVDCRLPVGRPPAALTDGMRHLQPYLTFSHRLADRSSWRLFAGLRCDVVQRTRRPGEFGKNALRRGSGGITAGFVFDRRNWHYTFEAAYDTARALGRGSEDRWMMRPGVLWEVPSRRNRAIRSQWVVGAAVSATFGPGGRIMGGSLRLRYNLGLKAGQSHSLFGSGR